MKVLGVFRGFPGLGRVVSGVSLLETLRDEYHCEVKAISYLQGNKYLKQRGFCELQEASTADYCSIGLLPTNKIGVYLHSTIKSFKPNLIIVDGEPLIIQSIKISHPDIKVVALLNPSDVDNPSNDSEAMDYFNSLYSMADLAIVHGLRNTIGKYSYKHIVSLPTILRPEIIYQDYNRGDNIYCVLGGGTVNSSQEFIYSSVKIAELCLKTAHEFHDREMHIVCSCKSVAKSLLEQSIPQNVTIHKDILPAYKIYSDASLIITRSGRNTLSEVAYLGIPTVSFIAGDRYRKEEQLQNSTCFSCENVLKAPLDIDPDSFRSLCLSALTGVQNETKSFVPGNELAIDSILNLMK